MKPATKTYLMLKYGSHDNIVDAYCEVGVGLTHPDDKMFCEYLEWYIDDVPKDLPNDVVVTRMPF